MLTTFKRQCTLGPLTLTNGPLKKTYNCPCNDNAYCSATGFCKVDARYLIQFTNLRPDATLSGTETVTFDSGLNIYSLQLKKYNGGRMNILNFPCTGKIEGNIKKWECQLATNCYDTITDGDGTVKNRITGSLDISNKCLPNGDYFLTACSGSYCANAVNVTVANNSEDSMANFCKTNGYQCGQLNGIWANTNCGTCPDGQYCAGNYTCQVDDRNCGNRTCGFAGNIKPLKPCGGTGATGDFGDGKGGCLTNYICSNQRCVWEGDCKTNDDCNKKAFPSKCLDYQITSNDNVRIRTKVAWNDIPYCLNKNCGHNPEPEWQDNFGVWRTNSASKVTVCQVGQECYIASDNKAYCRNLKPISSCSCDDITKPCCASCKPGINNVDGKYKATKCSGGIMATSYYVIPEPPTCVTTGTCVLKDFARDNFYETPTPAGFLTGKNNYSNGPSNVTAVAKIDPDFTYHPAIAYCENLTTGGFTDWYLPAQSELLSIYTNYFEKNKTKDATRKYFLDGAKNYAYYPYTGMMWGSYVTSQAYYGDIRNVWSVNFIHSTPTNPAPTGYIPGGADNNTANKFGSGLLCVRKIK